MYITFMAQTREKWCEPNMVDNAPAALWNVPQLKLTEHEFIHDRTMQIWTRIARNTQFNNYRAIIARMFQKMHCGIHCP